MKGWAGQRGRGRGGGGGGWRSKEIFQPLLSLRFTHENCSLFFVLFFVFFVSGAFFPKTLVPFFPSNSQILIH